MLRDGPGLGGRGGRGTSRGGRGNGHTRFVRLDELENVTRDEANNREVAARSVETGSVFAAKHGQYFPFTTFRRLIAHTRLTFILFQSGVVPPPETSRGLETRARRDVPVRTAFPSHSGGHRSRLPILVPEGTTFYLSAGDCLSIHRPIHD